MTELGYEPLDEPYLPLPPAESEHVESAACESCGWSVFDAAWPLRWDAKQRRWVCCNCGEVQP